MVAQGLVDEAVSQLVVLRLPVTQVSPPMGRVAIGGSGSRYMQERGAALAAAAAAMERELLRV